MTHVSGGICSCFANPHCGQVMMTSNSIAIFNSLPLNAPQCGRSMDIVPLRECIPLTTVGHDREDPAHITRNGGVGGAKPGSRVQRNVHPCSSKADLKISISQNGGTVRQCSRQQKRNRCCSYDINNGCIEVFIMWQHPTDKNVRCIEVPTLPSRIGDQ